MVYFIIMRNAWIFPSFSHSTGKCNKTHRMGRTWEIGTQTFPMVWVLFYHLISILWYTSSYEKCMSFSVNFPYTGKCNKSHRMRRTWEIGTRTFPIVQVLFSHSIPILWYLHYVGNAWVFPSICHSSKNSNKTHRMGRTRETGTHTFPIVWVLFSR